MAAAFNQSTMNHLNNTIRTLFYRRQKISLFRLTEEEYLTTFVPREARELFRQVTPYIDPPKHGRWTLALPGGVSLKASLVTDKLPVCDKLEIQPDAPENVVSKIVAWAEQGGDQSREFARVQKVLDILNTGLSRVAIRYYWPTIIALCSESESTKHLVQEMQELRTPARLKPLPSGLAQACRLSAETIATTRLIPHDVEVAEADALLSISTSQFYTEAGVGSFYGLA